MHERLSALLSNYIAICRFEILQKNKRKKKGGTKIDRRWICRENHNNDLNN